MPGAFELGRAAAPAPEFRVYTAQHLTQIPQLHRLGPEHVFAMRVVAKVLPFRVNKYVIDELIDWDNVPDDPMFQLTFPQPGMLLDRHFRQIADLMKRKASANEVNAAVHAIHHQLNPHPAEQRTLNVPHLKGRPLAGMQHKYRQTVLFFPSQGQTCHSFCTFCFRWPQFVRDTELRIASKEARNLHTYLAQHPEVTDLLVTGGDPMVMNTRHLMAYLEPLLAPEYAHLSNIRIGTKALTYWPYRFTSDSDADELLQLFARLVRAGKHVALMAHHNHWRELEPEPTRRAIERIRDTGAVIRSQGPVLKHINDDAETWARLWGSLIQLGIVPYYMFVERDTGARHYFELPLVRCWEIFQEAIQQVSGLARTVRGPSMSAGPGKVEVQGVSEIQNEKVFVLRFLQGRNPDWVHRPFFAQFDEGATWLDQLKPAFGLHRFFFEDEYDAMRRDVLVSN